MAKQANLRTNRSLLAAALALILGAGGLPLASAQERSDAPKAAEPAAEAADVRFGLTEAERQKVFRELAAAERRAEAEAEKRAKGDPEPMEAIDLAQQLSDRYQKEIAEKYGLTPEQLVLIQSEGFEKDWSAQP